MAIFISPGGGGGTPGGSDTQIQFNDGGAFGGDADLTYNKTTNLLTTKGDITLSDSGTYTTTLQCITPTANRTLSLPNADGTVGLVAGSSGQIVWNSSGAYAGASTLTYDGSILTTSGRFINSYNATASSPAKAFTGTWFTGGTGTTTKPQVLIEPTGTTSTAWSTSGTGFGVNAASGFAGNLLDLQVNGTSNFRVSSGGGLFLQNTGNNYTAPQHTVGGTTNWGFGWHGSETYKWFLFANGARVSAIGPSGISVASSIAFASTTPENPDLYVHRDASNTLAQRNGGSAQTFRVYGTESSSLANHVRASLSCSSTAVTLAAESAGTGAADVPINLTAKGTGTVKANSNLEVADAKDVVLGTTTGTKIGTATTQKLGFYNKTPVVQPTAVADITTTATAGTLPTPNGSVTIADAAAPTNAELLEYCVELEAKLEAALSRLRDLGLIAT